MFCTSCGARFEPGTAFCTSCGAPTASDAAPAVGAPVAPFAAAPGPVGSSPLGPSPIPPLAGAPGPISALPPPPLAAPGQLPGRAVPGVMPSVLPGAPAAVGVPKWAIPVAAALAALSLLLFILPRVLGGGSGLQRALVGSWQCDGETITFQADGTGTMGEPMGGVLDDLAAFNWQTAGRGPFGNDQISLSMMGGIVGMNLEIIQQGANNIQMIPVPTAQELASEGYQSLQQALAAEGMTMQDWQDESSVTCTRAVPATGSGTS